MYQEETNKKSHQIIFIIVNISVLISLAYLLGVYKLFKQPEIAVEQDGLTTIDYKKWIKYHDEKNNFSLEYPNDLDSYSREDGVSFAKDGLSVYDISIYDDYRSLEERIAYIENENKNSKVVIEKEIAVAGEKAIVYYMSDEYEEYRDTKTIIFISNNKLFELIAKGQDYELLLKNFVVE